MKKWILALLIAALAALLVPVGASAATHHHKKPIHCKKGTHRNGRQCVKTPASTQGPAGPAGPSGPSGPTGPVGSPGVQGSTGGSGSQGTPGAEGAEGSPGAEGPEGSPAPVSPLAYDNITPESRIDNPVSLGYAATSSTQFGSQIALGGEGGVTDPEVEVLMSVWTCELGEWNLGCVTADPNATFDAPLTLNVYAVGSENSVGALLTTETETFALHYRPSSDPTCADPTSFKASDGHCQHGLPEGVAFDLPGTLPHRVILAVEYTPTGPLSALNVALEGPATVGSNPVEGREGVYWDSAFYGGFGGTFGYEQESGEWAPGESQIAARVIR